MWPIKEKENRTAFHNVAKSYPLWLAARMRRYSSLININLSSLQHIALIAKVQWHARHIRYVRRRTCLGRKIIKALFQDISDNVFQGWNKSTVGIFAE